MEFTLKNQKQGLNTIVTQMSKRYDEIDNVRIELEKLYDHYIESKDVDNKTKESVTYLLESLCMVWTEELYIENLKRDFVLDKLTYSEFRKQLHTLFERRKGKLDESFSEVVKEQDWFTDELHNHRRFGYTTIEKQGGLPVLLNGYYDVPLDIFKEEYQGHGGVL